MCVVAYRGCCFQAEDGIRDLVRSRGLGDVYKRQPPIPVNDIGQDRDCNYIRATGKGDVLVPGVRNDTVSYTHLTLPTSDLV